MKGRIFDIQRFSQGNGPGIRTTVFMKGCSLRCRWCHNPESLIREKQIMVNLQLCHHCGDCVSACLHRVHEIVSSEHLIHADRCIGCGKCVDACCYGYLSLQGKDISPVDLADILLKDEGYYKTSDGGVTFSGGEPLLQIAFLEEVSRHLKGISIYFDTSGCCPEKSFLQMLSIADGVLFDIKHLDSGRHRELTGVGNEHCRCVYR